MTTLRKLPTHAPIANAQVGKNHGNAAATSAREGNIGRRISDSGSRKVKCRAYSRVGGGGGEASGGGAGGRGRASRFRGISRLGGRASRARWHTAGRAQQRHEGARSAADCRSCRKRRRLSEAQRDRRERDRRGAGRRWWR